MSSSLTEIVVPHRPPDLPSPAVVTDGDRGSLFVALAVITDLRGRRYPLVSVLTATVCAVLAEARPFAAVADWMRFQDHAVWGSMAGCPPRRRCGGR